MKIRLLRAQGALIGCLVVLSLSVLPAQTAPDKQQIIRDARQAYYNLRDEGLSEFQCQLTPNWLALLGDLPKTNPAGANAAVRTLSQIHFEVKLDSVGKVKLTHN